MGMVRRDLIPGSVNGGDSIGVVSTGGRKPLREKGLEPPERCSRLRGAATLRSSCETRDVWDRTYTADSHPGFDGVSLSLPPEGSPRHPEQDFEIDRQGKKASRAGAEFGVPS